MRRSWLAAALAGAALIFGGAPEPAAAATITYDFNTEYSGGQAPAGPPPWIVVTFSDTSTPGQVQLTISTSGLTGATNIAEIDFNLDPALNVTQLTFTSLNHGGSTISANAINLQENGFMADGDGLYDINMTYNTGTGKTFTGGLTSTYDITYSGSGTLSASSFFFLSTPSGGHGPFYAASHVQNTTGPGSGGSGWVAPVAAVPLPSAVWLLLSGLGVFAGASTMSARRTSWRSGRLTARPRAVEPALQSA